MLTLGASQALEGSATNATTVNYTIVGLLMTNASPPVASTYESLAQGQLSNTAGSMYNPGGSNTAIISAINLFNTGASQQSVALYIGGTAAANQVASISIPAGGWAEYDGLGWTVYNSSGLQITAPTTALSLAYPGILVGAVADSMPVSTVITNATSITLGTPTMIPIELPVGVPVGHLAFSTATTAISTPTHWWFALCDSSRNLLAITADQTTAAWAANTVKVLAIANTAAGAGTLFVPTYSGTHYMAVVIAGSTAPTMAGATAETWLWSGSSATLSPGKSSTTGLTTPSTFPTQYGAITALSLNLWAEAAA